MLSDFLDSMRNIEFVQREGHVEFSTQDYNKMAAFIGLPSLRPFSHRMGGANLTRRENALWNAICKITNQFKVEFDMDELKAMIVDGVFDGNLRVFTGACIEANIRDSLQELRNHRYIIFEDDNGRYSIR